MKKILFIICILILSGCSLNKYSNYDNMLNVQVKLEQEEAVLQDKKSERKIYKIYQDKFLTPETAVKLIQSVYLTDKRGNLFDKSNITAEFLRNNQLKAYINEGKSRFFTFTYNNKKNVIIFPKFIFSDASFRDILRKEDFNLAVPYVFDLNKKNPYIDHFDKYATNDEKAQLLDFLFGSIMSVKYFNNEKNPFVRLSTSKYEGGSIDVYLLDKNGEKLSVDFIIKKAVQDTVESLNFFQRNLLKVLTLNKNSRLNKFVIFIPKERMNYYR